MKRVIWASSATALLLIGCGGAAVPQDQLATAQATQKGAEVAGAAEDPKAALHLKLATEQIDKAKALIANGDNEQAASVVDRAQADAELAIVLAKEARAKKEAADAREQVEELKQRLQK
ncbi:MAG TPA: DUF4398 domain-containing protein [Polyangiaceae bacterium]|jgi:hypothetical protein|nr:DUF4398 domain-containing protein [Polyangiaceae bacterium]